VIDYLRETFKDKYVVLYAYCNFMIKEKEQQTAVNLMSSLLRHLATDHETDGIRKPVMKFYHEFKAKGSRPSMAEYSKILCQILQTLDKRVFIVVDALDECSDDDRGDFLAELEKLPVRLFCTTRDIPEIIYLFHNNVTQLSVHNQVKATKEDIKTYLQSEMKKRASLAALNPSLAADIVRVINEKADGMYIYLPAPPLSHQSLALADIYNSIQNTGYRFS